MQFVKASYQLNNLNVKSHVYSGGEGIARGKVAEHPRSVLVMVMLLNNASYACQEAETGGLGCKSFVTLKKMPG